MKGNRSKKGEGRRGERGRSKQSSRVRKRLADEVGWWLDHAVAPVTSEGV